MSFSWEELPEYDDVRQALLTQANLKARLKMAKLELEIYQAELTRERPRDSSVKLIGIDDTSKARLRELLSAVSEAEVALDQADAEVTFNKHRIDINKAIAYKGRI